MTRPAAVPSPEQVVAKGFGKKLQQLRRQTGLSQEQLADLASLHRTEIGMLERGIRLPRIDTLLKLAGALGTSPSDLLDGMRWEPGTPAPVGQFSQAG